MAAVTMVGSMTPDRTALVFAFICAFKSSHDGNSRTLDELVTGCGIPQTTLVYHLLKLQRQGSILNLGPVQSRCLRALAKPGNTLAEYATCADAR